MIPLFDRRASTAQIALSLFIKLAFKSMGILSSLQMRIRAVPNPLKSLPIRCSIPIIVCLLCAAMPTFGAESERLDKVLILKSQKTPADLEKVQFLANQVRQLVDDDLLPGELAEALLSPETMLAIVDLSVIDPQTDGHLLCDTRASLSAMLGSLKGRLRLDALKRSLVSTCLVANLMHVINRVNALKTSGADLANAGFNNGGVVGLTADDRKLLNEKNKLANELSHALHLKIEMFAELWVGLKVDFPENTQRKAYIRLLGISDKDLEDMFGTLPNAVK